MMVRQPFSGEHMTSVRRGRYSFAFLLVVALGTAVVWMGKPVEAQPQEDNMRQQMEALRASTVNGPGHAPSDTAGALYTSTVLGNATDFFVPGDFDGDGKQDHAVWTPGAPGVFKIRRSSDGVLVSTAFGSSGYDPTVTGDYDGDGKDDMASYAPGASAGQYSVWYYISSSAGGVVTVPCSAMLDCGKNGDFPMPGDIDGDGKSDFVVQRLHQGAPCAVDNTQGTPAPFTPNADFLITLNGGAVTTVHCVGRASDVIVPGDYDGDDKTDLALVRGVSGTIQWSVRRSTNLSYFFLSHGLSASDFPTQGDYDGDGKTDAAVWRPSAVVGASAFFIRPSVGGMTVQFRFGLNGDYPVANWNAH
jgi:hypothetical protein